MSDDGFTLPDALSALVVVGLALTGLVQAVHVGARSQRSISEDLRHSVHLRRAQARLSNVFRGGVVRAADPGTRGDSRSLTYACEGGPCSMLVDDAGEGGRLRQERDAQTEWSISFGDAASPEFRYIDHAGRESSRWPGNDPAARLLAIAVVDASRATPRALIAARTWIDQETTCVFDTVSRDCLRARDD